MAQERTAITPPTEVESPASVESPSAHRSSVESSPNMAAAGDGAAACPFRR